MLVTMNVMDALEFLKQHREALECSVDESLLTDSYDAKLICALDITLSAVDSLVHYEPSIMHRGASYEYEIFRKGKRRTNIGRPEASASSEICRDKRERVREILLELFPSLSQ